MTELRHDDARITEEGVRYEATPRRSFEKVVRNLPIEYKNYTFIDIGSGKGAVLLYAVSFGFKQIVGVEWSRRLHDIALANIRTFSARSGANPQMIRLHCMDARAYAFPCEPTVLYLFNPFSERMMATILENLERSLDLAPREMILLNYYPRLEALLDSGSRLRRTRTGFEYSLYSNSIDRRT
jgi:16S rRNA G966 N2-methylase RsmD